MGSVIAWAVEYNGNNIVLASECSLKEWTAPTPYLWRELLLKFRRALINQEKSSQPGELPVDSWDKTPAIQLCDPMAGGPSISHKQRAPMPLQALPKSPSFEQHKQVFRVNIFVCSIVLFFRNIIPFIDSLRFSTMYSDHIHLHFPLPPFLPDPLSLTYPNFLTSFLYALLNAICAALLQLSFTSFFSGISCRDYYTVNWSRFEYNLLWSCWRSWSYLLSTSILILQSLRGVHFNSSRICIYFTCCYSLFREERNHSDL